MKEKEKEELRPLLVSAIKLYRGGDRGRLLATPTVCSILHFASRVAPDKKGGRKKNDFNS